MWDYDQDDADCTYLLPCHSHSKDSENHIDDCVQLSYKILTDSASKVGIAEDTRHIRHHDAWQDGPERDALSC